MLRLHYAKSADLTCVRLLMVELKEQDEQKEFLDCVKIRIIQRLFLTICIIKIICKRIDYCKLKILPQSFHSANIIPYLVLAMNFYKLLKEAQHHIHFDI